MARYIDAVDCAEIISKECNIPLGDLVDVFAKVPTADVVEVVRCKNCKRCYEKRTKRNKQLMRFCMRMDGNEYQVNANDFCSYGERSDT